MNPMKLMKQMQQMQDKLERELAEMEVEASAGGDMVTIKMNGKKELLGVQIDPEVVDKDEVEMLQEMIVAAFRECARKIDDNLKSTLGGMTGGMKLPFGM